MLDSPFSTTKQLDSVRKILGMLADRANLRISVRLWDGTMVPLGKDVDTPYFISIASPGVLGAILRRPSAERLLRLYATGHIDFHGGNLIEIGDVFLRFTQHAEDYQLDDDTAVQKTKTPVH